MPFITISFNGKKSYLHVRENNVYIFEGSMKLLGIDSNSKYMSVPEFIKKLYTTKKAIKSKQVIETIFSMIFSLQSYDQFKGYTKIIQDMDEYHKKTRIPYYSSFLNSKHWCRKKLNEYIKRNSNVQEPRDNQTTSDASSSTSRANQETTSDASKTNQETATDANVYKCVPDCEKLTSLEEAIPFLNYGIEKVSCATDMNISRRTICATRMRIVFEAQVKHGYDVVEYMLESGYCNKFDEELWYSFASNLMEIGRIDVLESLFETGCIYANMYARDGSNLYSAAVYIKEICPKISGIFDKYGVDVNHANIYGETPLILAAHEGDDVNIKCLIDAGANVNVYGRCGESPVSIVAESDNAFVLQLLLANGAKIHKDLYKNIKGCPSAIVVEGRSSNDPLLEACRTLDLKTVKAIIDKTGDPNGANVDGDTPLMTALSSFCHKRTNIKGANIKEEDYYHIVKCLVDAGAEIQSCFFNDIERGYDNVMCLFDDVGAIDRNIYVFKKILNEHFVVFASRCIRDYHVNVRGLEWIYVEDIVKMHVWNKRYYGPMEKRKATMMFFHLLIQFGYDFGPDYNGHLLKDDSDPTRALEHLFAAAGAPSKDLVASRRYVRSLKQMCINTVIQNKVQVPSAYPGHCMQANSIDKEFAGVSSRNSNLRPFSPGSLEQLYYNLKGISSIKQKRGIGYKDNNSSSTLSRSNDVRYIENSFLLCNVAWKALHNGIKYNKFQPEHLVEWYKEKEQSISRIQGVIIKLQAHCNVPNILDPLEEHKNFVANISFKNNWPRKDYIHQDERIIKLKSKTNVDYICQIFRRYKKTDPAKILNRNQNKFEIEDLRKYYLEEIKKVQKLKDIVSGFNKEQSRGKKRKNANH